MENATRAIDTVVQQQSAVPRGIVMIEITRASQVIEEKECDIINPGYAKMMMDRIVIDVTYNCSMSCANCNRLCGAFPRTKDISLDTVRLFVKDSIETERRWRSIYICGGEPALHPHLPEIYKELGKYVKFFERFYKDDFLNVAHFTNNILPQSRKMLKELPNFVNRIWNSQKDNLDLPFIPMMVAPIDLGWYDDKNLKPCLESYGCGMTLNYRGYFPCAESAVISEILLRKNYAIKSLKQATFKRLAAILHKTCRYCGYYFEPSGFKRYNEMVCSKTWKKRIEEEYGSLENLSCAQRKVAEGRLSCGVGTCSGKKRRKRRAK